MTYHDDDDQVLYPDRVYAEGSALFAQAPGIPLVPNEATFFAFLNSPNVAEVGAIAFAILQRKPTVFAKLFRAWARKEAKRDAEAAVEVMRFIRQFLAEFHGAQHDAALHVQSVMAIARQIDRDAQLHALRTEQDLLGLREANVAAREERERRRAVTARSRGIIDNGVRGAFGPASGDAPVDAWDAQDDLSRRARVATIQGAASVDSERIDDPAVAFAALTYVKKLQSGADEDQARRAAFADVRDLLAANRLAPKDAEAYTQALKQCRAEFKKARDAKAGLGLMAAAITGRKA